MEKLMADVQFSTIEISDEPISEIESREPSSETLEKNGAFEAAIVEECNSKIMIPCNCKATAAFLERCRRRAMITQSNDARAITPDKELYDQFQFCATVHDNHGVHMDCPLIIRQCNCCNALLFFGNATNLMSLLNIAEVSAINSGAMALDISDDTEEVESIETDDLIEMLEEGGLDNVEMFPINGKVDESDETPES